MYLLAPNKRRADTVVVTFSVEWRAQVSKINACIGRNLAHSKIGWLCMQNKGKAVVHTHIERQ